MFWAKLMPLLEGYWAAGRDDPDAFPVPKRYAQAFPYERAEVERVLRSFTDPCGPVTKEAKANFRRCGCVDAGGRRRVCVPPAPGFMCTRRALLFKVKPPRVAFSRGVFVVK